MSQIYLGDKLIASTEGSDIKYDENTSVKEKIDEFNSNLDELNSNLEQVFQLGSNRKTEVITALQNSGFDVSNDISWDEIPLYISNYKCILVNQLAELYPTDALGLTGGFSGALSHHNSKWDESCDSATRKSINPINFENIKTLQINHSINKYHDSAALPISVQVGLTDSSGKWIVSQKRSISSGSSTKSYTETFDTTSLTGEYFITYSYSMYCRTNGSISKICIQV